MRISTAALVAGFAAATSAFLLPPNIEELKKDIKDTRFRGPPKHFKDLIHSLLEEKTTTVDLECPGCPYATARSEEEDSASGAIVWEQDVENVIRLDFDTHENGFNVNGHPLLPLERAQQSSSVMIKAHQIRKDAESSEPSVEIPLSFALEVLPSHPSPHHVGVSVVPVEFTILAMDGVPVKVNTIVLKLIQTPANSYVIVHTEEVPFKDTPGANTCGESSRWTLCRIKAIIASRLKSIMEATKEKANKVHGWISEKTTGCRKGQKFGKHPHTQGHHPRPHHWKGHGHRAPHYRGNRFGQVIRQTFRLLIIPSLLVIIGSLTASAIGMLVARAIIYVWFRTYRNGQRGPLRIYEQEIAIIQDEQDDLLPKGDEVLPQYEDAPAYKESIGQENEKQ